MHRLEPQNPNKSCKNFPREMPKFIPIPLEASLFYTSSLICTNIRGEGSSSGKPKLRPSQLLYVLFPNIAQIFLGVSHNSLNRTNLQPSYRYRTYSLGNGIVRKNCRFSSLLHSLKTRTLLMFPVTIKIIFCIFFSFFIYAARKPRAKFFPVKKYIKM